MPGFHQALYQQRVASAGTSSRLVQRTVSGFGHCTFTPSQLAAAFFDLVAWVEYGVPPAS